MKQVYFFIAAMLVGTFASAQELMPVQAAKEKLSFKKASMTPAQIDRDAFWSNDCNVDNCSDWVFDNGADIADSPWEGININFECTTEGPSGPYNGWVGGFGDGTHADPLNSTTSGNGFIIIDSDLAGGDIIEAGTTVDWVENCWFQTADPIDCSLEEFVSISLETRYRYWDELSDEAQCFIEISRDGVNWPSIETRDEESGYVVYGNDTVPSRKILFPGFSNTDASENPSIIEFDISEAAGNQPTVYLRFRWMGSWGYSWEIDDIQLYQTPENDTRIDNYISYTDYERTFVYEYGAWAQSQIPENLQAAAKAYNVGYADQTGVTLTLDYNGTVASSDPIDTLAFQTNDTLAVAYQPSGLGDVNLAYTLFTDSVDENPSNNTADASFTITDLSFGRDDGFINYAYPAGEDEGTIDYIAVSLYDIVEDVMIYGIDVAIIEGSEQGSPLLVHLFDATDPGFLESEYGGILVSSDEVDLNTNYLNAPGEEVQNWYRYIFEEPHEASAGDWLGAGFEHYGGGNVQYGESKYTQDNTAFVYGPFGTGTYAWYYTNDVPMIRLNLDPASIATPANVSDVHANNGFELFPSFPNPTNGVTTVKFNLDFASEVAFEMRDITGKVVYNVDMGTKAAGMNNLTLDATDFAAGAYTYTLTVNGERATDRLLVK